MLSPTQSEFEAFPPTLQRKCFSELERLRYAQAAKAHAASRALQITMPPVTSVGTVSAVARSNTKRRHPSAPGTTKKPSLPTVTAPAFLSRATGDRSRRGSGRGQLTAANISQEDALWFSRLPEKVKRGQFSVEEQALLTGRSETAVYDSDHSGTTEAEALFYQLRRARTRAGAPNRSVPSLSSAQSSDTEEAPSDRDYSPVTVPSDNEEEGGKTAGKRSTMESAMLDSFRWIDREEPLDLALTEYATHLDDYHTHIAATAERSKTPSFRRPSYRRPVTGLAVGVGMPTTPRHAPPSPNKLPVPPKNVQPSRAPRPIAVSRPTAPPKLIDVPAPSRRRTSTSDSHTSTASPASRPSLDSEAAHYLNPEARLKLRLYLATPSHFDEALEFGFPTTTPSSPPPNSATTASSSLMRRPSLPHNTFRPPKIAGAGPTARAKLEGYACSNSTVSTRPFHRRSKSLGAAAHLFSSSRGTMGSNGPRTFLDDATVTTSSSVAGSFYIRQPWTPPTGLNPVNAVHERPRLDLSPSTPAHSRSASEEPLLLAPNSSVSALSTACTDDTAVLADVVGAYSSTPLGDAAPVFTSVSSIDTVTPPLNADATPDALLRVAPAPIRGSCASEAKSHGSPTLIEEQLAPDAPREMTLRVTLTRPDLRDDGPADYTPQYIRSRTAAGASTSAGNKPRPSLRERVVGTSFGASGAVAGNPPRAGESTKEKEKAEGGGLKRLLSRRW